MKPVTWVKKFLLLFLVLSLVTIVFNMLIDPYDSFRILSVRKINQNKYYDLNRIAKSIRLSHDIFDIIILGSSRTLVGMDTRDKAFGDKRVFNASLGETNILELNEVLKYILENNSELDTLVYGIDFLTFSDKRTLKEHFTNSLFNENGNRIKTYLRVLYAPKIIRHSLLTIKKNLKSIQPAIINGYRSKEKAIVNHRDLFEEILRSKFLIQRETYGCFEYDRDRMMLFQGMLLDLVKKKIKTYLFISPLHARQYTAMKILGLTDDYYFWMQELVATVEEVERETGVEIPLWDFGGFNSVTTEEIPDNLATQMSYFWESSHYKKKTGSIMLQTMLKDSRAIADFGVLLTQENIHNRIALMDSGMASYSVNYPEEVKSVEMLYDSTKQIRAQHCPERY